MASASAEFALAFHPSPENNHDAPEGKTLIAYYECFQKDRGLCRDLHGSWHRGNGIRIVGFSRRYSVRCGYSQQKSAVTADEDAPTSEKSAYANAILLKTNLVVESTITVDEDAPPVETEADGFRWNVPSKGDDIHDEYFVHTYSNGQHACIPFDAKIERNYSNIPTRPIDAAALKNLGEDETLTDEICYEVVEFLDGTKRYFKLGEAPFAFTDPLRYGIYTYIEGGSGEYYSEVLPNGMILSGWR